MAHCVKGSAQEERHHPDSAAPHIVPLTLQSLREVALIHQRRDRAHGTAYHIFCWKRVIMIHEHTHMGTGFHWSAEVAVHCPALKSGFGILRTVPLASAIRALETHDPLVPVPPWVGMGDKPFFQPLHKHVHRLPTICGGLAGDGTCLKVIPFPSQCF